MIKSQRIKPIVRIARDKETSAARVMGEHQKILAEHEARLEELKLYQKEYSQRLAEKGQSGVDIARINEYRHFLSNLNQAVRQQQALVEMSKQALEEKNSQWAQSRAKHKALDKVMHRYRQQEHRIVERREQAESDERALHNPQRHQTED
ncbi:MAG: flagellar export protein FliJ [Gammaproteobacteria bacterium]